MFVRQTIEIRPNNKQKTYFRQCFGAHRLAYNYGLREWIRLRDSGQKTNVRQIRTTFNAQKPTRWPFLYRVSSSASCMAFDDLKRAFDNFFHDHEKIGAGNNSQLSGFPQPKSKSYNEGSFTEYFDVKGSGGPKITDHRVVAKDIKCSTGAYGTKFIDQPKADNANERKPYLRLPRIGTVRMMRPLRYEGRPVSVTIRQKNERFYACFLIEITEKEFYRVHPRYAKKPKASVGIDLGIKELAVTSDGLLIENQRHMERQLDHENRLQARMNRCKGKGQKKKPSKRFLKAKQKLWRLRTRIRHQREDLRNKLCAIILANYQHIGIETLRTNKMADSVKNRENKHKLNMHLRDVSLYEIRHRLQTLGELLGRHIVSAPSNFPSTRRCSRCGHVEPPLNTNQRLYICPKCGLTIDRDLNAAINLRKLTGRGTSSSTAEANPMRSELIKSDIKHRNIGDGQEVGTRS